jgi:hypothetical protein
MCQDCRSPFYRVNLRILVDLKGTDSMEFIIDAKRTGDVPSKSNKADGEVDKSTYFGHQCTIYQSCFVKNEPSIPIRVIIAEEVANRVMLHGKESMQHLHSCNGRKVSHLRTEENQCLRETYQSTSYC